MHTNLETKPEKEKINMKSDIILSGVGGQGILSIAAIIAEAALKEGLFIKQAEVHGMSQRGGDVHSNLRVSSNPIYSDLITPGCADVIISLEPMEALRYLPYLSPEGWIITNTVPFQNIPNYPEPEALLKKLQELPHVVLLDIDAIAKEQDTPRAANMVLLGAAADMIGIAYDKLEMGIEWIFGRKGDDVVAMNKRALKAGWEAAKKQKQEKNGK